MRISDEKIEEVRTASDIVEVISEFVSLKKRGTHFIGLCPFHQEKTPSFHVNPAMGIYKCFGCGKGGDVYNFLMDHEHLGFYESIKVLAARAHIHIPEEASEDTSPEIRLEPLYHALRFSAKFYWEQLTKTDEGKKYGLSYFRERGFLNETIRKFGLGYAPNGWDGLIRASEAAQIKVEHLEQAGLILPSQRGGHYDRFRGRALFPIISHIGKVIGFGGRILSDAKDQPKYINSPETPVYQKSHVLFGLFQAKNAIRATQEVLLVEGYTDVISLHQAGIHHAVATSGTALTNHQVKLLGRYARQVLMVFDADSAGEKAMLRGINLLFSGGLSPQVVTLEKGADPDSFVRQFGGVAFLNYIQKYRQDFISFKFDHAKKQGLWNTPEGKSQVVHEVVETIACILDPIKQDLYLQEAARVLAVPENSLRRVLGAVRSHQTASVPRTGETVVVKRFHAQGGAAETFGQSKPHAAESILARLMLTEGAEMIYYVFGHMTPQEFTAGVSTTLVELLLNHVENGAVEVNRMVRGDFGADIREWVTEVLMNTTSVSKKWGVPDDFGTPSGFREPYKVAEDAMTRLKLFRIDQMIERLSQELRLMYENNAEDEQVLSQIRDLHIFRKGIEQRTFLQDNAS
ncbi:MAG: DNA primase [Rhodothermia bacterium]|nr:DNA primase [Rhodothermia bacterium]